jgi:nucleotide-binding universal stress UspA family protein
MTSRVYKGHHMYAKIMVAIDGSAIAMRALEEAMQLAKSLGAELMPVYVVEYPHAYVSDLGYDPPTISETLINEGTRALEKAICLMKNQSIAPRSLLVDDRYTLSSIAEQLQKASEEYGADLIVLGTHGRGGFKRLLLGSVAEAFVRLSTRPVLLVPAAPHEK